MGNNWAGQADTATGYVLYISSDKEQENLRNEKKKLGKETSGKGQHRIAHTPIKNLYSGLVSIMKYCGEPCTI